jgi:hypothetical protein
MSSALERARGLVRDLGVRDRAALSQHPRRGEIDELQQEILAAQSQLTELGVEVKGGEPALVDFPGLRHGVEVCLCWKEGEEQVEHWHPVHTGYAGRAPIGETPAEAWHWSH